MSTDNVQKIALLLLWATGPGLAVALELGVAWGFEYKTVAFVWVKKNRNDTDRFFIRDGLLHAGECRVGAAVYERPAVAKSAKGPGADCYREGGESTFSEARGDSDGKIVELFGDRPRVELFAEERRAACRMMNIGGWDVFGNEKGGRID